MANAMVKIDSTPLGMIRVKEGELMRGDVRLIEAQRTLQAGIHYTAMPPYKGVDGTFPEGKALPAVKARLKVGRVDVTKPVHRDDKAATFTVELTAGETHLKTWFYDADGGELCGAFYVDVRRL